VRLMRSGAADRARKARQGPWLPMSNGAYMSSAHEATWRSGYAAVCKTVYTSSILVVASIPSH
jgi:hypothetical protein